MLRNLSVMMIEEVHSYSYTAFRVLGITAFLFFSHMCRSTPCSLAYSLFYMIV